MENTLKLLNLNSDIIIGLEAELENISTLPYYKKFNKEEEQIKDIVKLGGLIIGYKNQRIVLIEKLEFELSQERKQLIKEIK